MGEPLRHGDRDRGASLLAARPGAVDAGGAVEVGYVAADGHERVFGKGRNEYPPAMFEEGGAGASVRPIPPSNSIGVEASMVPSAETSKMGLP
jgi:hypothetical protein